MCKRYGGGVNYVMELDIVTGCELIGKAYEESTDDRLFEIWNIEHVAEMLIRRGEYTSFDEYKKSCYSAASKPPAPKLTAQEIIARAEKIKAIDQKRR